MKNDFKKIKLNALYQKQESDQLKNKWKNLTDQDPIEKDLALGEYVKSKTKYLKLLAQIKEHQQ